LQTLDFPSGYGIEFASLIDTYEMLGLDAIAQVDLGVRRHVHQDLASLGAMAAEVIAAAARRRFDDGAPAAAEICHVGRSAAGVADVWVDRPINLAERPTRAPKGEDRPNPRAVEGAR
jgi:glucosyl-3-phosphoglycerate synthase